MERAKRNLHLIVACLMLSLASLLTTFYLWCVLLQPSPLVYKNLPFPPMVATIVAGDVIPLQIVRCNNTEHIISYTTTHILKNIDNTKQTYVLPSLEIALEPGCTTNISMVNKTLRDVPPGTYVIVGRAKARGLFRDYNVDWYSSPFKITTDPSYIPQFEQSMPTTTTGKLP